MRILMKHTLLLAFALLLTGCMNMPEPAYSDAAIASEQIEENISEAQMAQKEYEELQSKRITE